MSPPWTGVFTAQLSKCNRFHRIRIRAAFPFRVRELVKKKLFGGLEQFLFPHRRKSLVVKRGAFQIWFCAKTHWSRPQIDSISSSSNIIQEAFPDFLKTAEKLFLGSGFIKAKVAANLFPRMIERATECDLPHPVV